MLCAHGVRSRRSPRAHGPRARTGSVRPRVPTATFLVLFNATLGLACVSRNGARAHQPPVLLLVWRSSPTQSQLGASSLAYRRIAIMRRDFLGLNRPDRAPERLRGVTIGYLLPLSEPAQLAARRPPQSKARRHKTSTVCHMVWSICGLSRIDEAATSRQPARRASRQTEPH
jgi:hypothetical protein